MSAEFDAANFIKDWVWAPVMGLIAWAWNHNEKEHEMLRSQAEKLQGNTSTGYSVLNDRVMEHIDKQVTDVRAFVVSEDVKLMNELSVQRNHIAKLFDKLEQHSKDSFQRHIELMNAINSKADK